MLLFIKTDQGRFYSFNYHLLFLVSYFLLSYKKVKFSRLRESAFIAVVLCVSEWSPLRRSPPLSSLNIRTRVCVKWCRSLHADVDAVRLLANEPHWWVKCVCNCVLWEWGVTDQTALWSNVEYSCGSLPPPWLWWPAALMFLHLCHFYFDPFLPVPGLLFNSVLQAHKAAGCVVVQWSHTLIF